MSLNVQWKYKNWNDGYKNLSYFFVLRAFLTSTAFKKSLCVSLIGKFCNIIRSQQQPT